MFLSTDKSIMGLEFSGGPLVFPGFCRGVKIPAISSSGCFPVFAAVLAIIQKHYLVYI